jgi:hypothetical protein
MTLVGMILAARRALAVVWARARFAGFATQSPQDDATAPGPALDLCRRLSGPILCDSVIYGLSSAGRIQGHVARATDWMSFLESGTIMNRSRFALVGVTVAEPVAVTRPAARG